MSPGMIFYPTYQRSWVILTASTLATFLVYLVLAPSSHNRGVNGSLLTGKCSILSASSLMSQVDLLWFD